MYNKLKNKLNVACKSYYLLGEEVISDQEYDSLYKELLILEKEQGFADDDSPTQKVGYSGLSNEKPHLHGRMLSLDNTHTKEELSGFFKNKTQNLVVMPKLDGLSLALYYTDGLLQLALLRGDGVKGSDVTDLAIQMKGVPLRTDIKKPFRIVGEIICFSDIWENREYKNHRNYVAGSMNMVDESKFKERELSFVAFDTSLEANSFEHKLEIISGINGIIPIAYQFSVNPRSQEELREEFRHFFPYCDGLVYAQNDLSLLPGATSHHPYNKVAFKFPPEQVESEILGVIWQMGRTKALTPVAIISDVILDGATVNRASLCNLNNISERDLAIGDKVIVHKAGEIIPQILKRVPSNNERITITITKCPECLKPVNITPTGMVSCTNPACGGNNSSALTHFCKAVGIKGIGVKIANDLTANFSLLEVLGMDAADLCNNSGIAEANSFKVEKSIQNSFSEPRWKAWAGLGIPLCGKSLSEKLPVDSLFDLDEDTLGSIPKVGETTVNKILFWIDENVELIAGVENLYTEKGEPEVVPEIVTTMYITGKLSMSRAKMTEKLLAQGIKVTTSLSKNTGLFLAGKGAKEHKIAKARELGIEVMYESDLLH